MSNKVKNKKGKNKQKQSSQQSLNCVTFLKELNLADIYLKSKQHDKTAHF